jgi:hypothetical protein
VATVAFRESLAVYAGTLMTHASLYTTTPTATTPGTEVTGSGWARQPVVWSAGASDGSITATIVFNVPAGQTVVGGGFHSALTGGNYLDGGALPSQPYTTAGTYTLNATLAVA